MDLHLEIFLIKCSRENIHILYFAYLFIAMEDQQLFMRAFFLSENSIYIIQREQQCNFPLILSSSLPFAFSFTTCIISL